MTQPPPCPECHGTKFLHIVDSLAYACEGCGFVWVGSGSEWGAGATLRELAAYTYEASTAREQVKG